MVTHPAMSVPLAVRRARPRCLSSHAALGAWAGLTLLLVEGVGHSSEPTPAPSTTAAPDAADVAAPTAAGEGEMSPPAANGSESAKPGASLAPKERPGTVAAPSGSPRGASDGGPGESAAGQRGALGEAAAADDTPDDEQSAPPLVWVGSSGIAAAIAAAGAASGLYIAARATDDKTAKWTSIGLFIGAGAALVVGVSLTIVGASEQAQDGADDAPPEPAPTVAVTPTAGGALLHGTF